MDENFIHTIIYNIGNLLPLMYTLTAEIFDRRYRYTCNFAICYHWCWSPIYIGGNALQQWV